MRLAALQFLALATLSMGFEAQPRLTNKRMHHRSYSDVPFTSSTSSINKPSQSTTSKSTSLNVINPILFSPDAIGPLILIVGAAAATIMADKNAEEVEIVESVPTPAPTPVVARPAPAPAPLVSAKIPVSKPAAVEEEVAIPESITYKDKDAKVSLVSSVDRTVRASAGVDKDTADSAVKSAGESIAELRRGVAKTLDDSFKVPSTQLLQRSSPAEAATNDEKVIQELIGKDDRKKRNLRQKIWRVVKKVVAPWRKWENIR